MAPAFISFTLFSDAFVKVLNPKLDTWLTAMEDTLVGNLFRVQFMDAR